MKTLATLFTILVLSLSVKAFACDDGKTCTDHKGNHASHDEKSEWRQKVDGQLDQIETQLNDLKAKTSSASTSAKADLDTRIAKLEQRRDEIRSEVDKMSTKSGNAWTKFKAGVQKAVGELQSGYQDAKNEFDKKTETKK